MRFSDLDEVNDQVNRERYVADPAGLDDWRPEANAGGKDCDSYATAKLRELVRRGWPVERLRLATCWTEDGGYHAVLVVTTDKGDYMLDNRKPRPVPIVMFFALGYRPHRIQGSGREWVEWLA